VTATLLLISSFVCHHHHRIFNLEKSERLYFELGRLLRSNIDNKDLVQASTCDLWIRRERRKAAPLLLLDRLSSIELV
jgi:hypothetical protein